MYLVGFRVTAGNLDQDNNMYVIPRLNSSAKDFELLLYPYIKIVCKKWQKRPWKNFDNYWKRIALVAARICKITTKATSTEMVCFVDFH